MSSLRFLVCLIFFLLLSTTIESRPLVYSTMERRKNLSLSIETTKRIAKEAISKGQYVIKPKRFSPGGPDPRHH